MITRRQFALGAGATALSGCSVLRPQFTVWVHGMTILDFTGRSLMIWMPMVPAGGSIEKDMSAMDPNPGQGGCRAEKAIVPPNVQASGLGHVYWLTNHATADGRVDLVIKGRETQYGPLKYEMAGIDYGRSRPSLYEDQDLYLHQSAGLVIDQKCILVQVKLPFPDRLDRYRTVRHLGGEPIVKGPVFGENGGPQSVPLVYGLVYDLRWGEKPSILYDARAPVWPKSGAANYLHMHAQPTKCRGGDHFRYLTGAFVNPPSLCINLGGSQPVMDCPPQREVHGTAPDELYGLLRKTCLSNSNCPTPIEPERDPDPGNCVSAILAG